MRRRAVITLVTACAAALPAGAARAQGQGHAHHGGQAQKIGRYEAELVVRGADSTRVAAMGGTPTARARRTPRRGARAASP